MERLSRIDSGVGAGDQTPLVLHRSLAEACEFMAPLASARGGELQCAAATTASAEILADRDQLRRLWLILLENAIKFTPAGGSVTASARGATVEVADTGIASRPNIRNVFSNVFAGRTRRADAAWAARAWDSPSPAKSCGGTER